MTDEERRRLALAADLKLRRENAMGLLSGRRIPGEDYGRSEVFSFWDSPAPMTNLRRAAALDRMPPDQLQKIGFVPQVSQETPNRALDRHPDQIVSKEWPLAGPLAAVDTSALDPVVVEEVRVDPTNHWRNPMSVRDAGVDYGPGLTPAAAEERYGPGGKFRTEPLPGGSYDQTGMNPTGTEISQGYVDQRMPETSTGESFRDEVDHTAFKGNILRGLIGLTGGDKTAADRYEQNRLAKLNERYATQVFQDLTEKELSSFSSLREALRKTDLPLSMYKSVFDASMIDKKVTDFTKFWKKDDDGKWVQSRELVGSPEWHKKLEDESYFQGANAPTTDTAKGFVNWTDGTETVTLPKGTRPRLADGSVDPSFHLGKASADATESNFYMVRDRETGDEFPVETDTVNGQNVFRNMDTGEIVSLTGKKVRTLGTDIDQGMTSAQRERQRIRSKRAGLVHVTDPVQRAKIEEELNQDDIAYAQANYRGGPTQQRDFIKARIAYNVGTANVDRVFDIFTKMPKTGAVQSIYEFKGAVVDQFKQLPFYFEDRARIDNLVTEIEGVKLTSNIIDLAYALAKSVDPNGRISDQDYKVMINTLAPMGKMDRNTIAAAVMEADSRIRRRMEAVYGADTSAQEIYRYQDLFKRNPVMIIENIGPNNESAVGFYPTGTTFDENGRPSKGFQAYFTWDPKREGAQ